MHQRAISCNNESVTSHVELLENLNFIFKPIVEFLLMWFGHSNGWLSIVAHRERPDDLLVRARRERHISTFWPDVEVVHNPDADYPYRSVIPRTDVAVVVMQYIEGIDYDNFKNSVDETNLKRAFERMWAVMYDYGVEHR